MSNPHHYFVSIRLPSNPSLFNLGRLDDFLKEYSIDDKAQFLNFTRHDITNLESYVKSNLQGNGHQDGTGHVYRIVRQIKNRIEWLWNDVNILYLECERVPCYFKYQYDSLYVSEDKIHWIYVRDDGIKRTKN